MSDEVASVGGDAAARCEADAGTDLLEVLGDECARRILTATDERPLTAKELTERCPVSSTTVYRRLNTLLECDLLSERVSFSQGQQRHKVYETTFDLVEASLDADGFTVRTYDGERETARLVRLLLETTNESIEADIEDETLRLSVPLTDDFFEELATRWSRGEVEE